MPWGWECRAKLIKQNITPPTVKRGPIALEVGGPSPDHYDTPEIFGGKGYSHIRRSPAYTFGYKTPLNLTKPVILPSAPLLDVSGLGSKGIYKIKHGLVSPQLEPIRVKGGMPGTSTYAPQEKLRHKRHPAYSLQPAARPPYQAWDQWTPPPNIYLPKRPGQKRPPAYTFGSSAKTLTEHPMPCPGEYDPNFNYIQKSRPAFSFGAPYRTPKQTKIPPPNNYCEKKFMYPKRTIPAPSFGIRHSPFIGKQEEHIKPENLNIVISGEN